jgi:hypothetical protein
MTYQKIQHIKTKELKDKLGKGLWCGYDKAWIDAPSSSPCIDCRHAKDKYFWGEEPKNYNRLNFLDLNKEIK